MAVIFRAQKTRTIGQVVLSVVHKLYIIPRDFWFNFNGLYQTTIVLLRVSDQPFFFVGL